MVALKNKKETKMLKTIWEKIKWVFGDEQTVKPTPAPTPVIEENCQCGKAEKVKAAKQRKPRTKKAR